MMSEICRKKFSDLGSANNFYRCLRVAAKAVGPDLRGWGKSWVEAVAGISEGSRLVYPGLIFRGESINFRITRWINPGTSARPQRQTGACFPRHAGRLWSRPAIRIPPPRSEPSPSSVNSTGFPSIASSAARRPPPRPLRI